MRTPTTLRNPALQPSRKKTRSFANCLLPASNPALQVAASNTIFYHHRTVLNRPDHAVTVSSRTPEGFPSECALCGASTNLEFSAPSRDAVCPNCGSLVWLSAELLSTFQRQFSDVLGVTLDRITPDTTLADLGADSLDLVELVMELDEEFDVSIPDDIAQRIQTIGDLMRYIEQQRRKPGG